MQESFSPIPSRQVRHALHRVVGREQLKHTLSFFPDANTRQDAAQKLETASHDSYVRKNWASRHFQPLLLIRRFHVARVHADALVGSKRRDYASACS